ncbi:MAG: ethylbenzene dehydrogenase-related protein, partial [Planctomycetota bacterium]
AAMERRYAPARAAGNQIASQKVTSAVQDLTAEGFGTLAFASEQRSTGQGVHGAGRWVVTICRPLDPSPGSATGLRPGASTFVAVAVWDGGRAHTGSKKMRSIWVPLQMEGPSS